MSAVRVQAERSEQVAASQRVVAAAFGEEPVAELLADLRRDHCWRGLSFVAVTDDGEVVGHVAYTRAWVDAPDRLVPVLVLSPLSVHPDRQRAGVGAALVRESLAALAERPEPVVFLEGDPGYYGRLGFEAAGSWGFTAPSARIPPAAFQAVRLPSYDASVQGALVYPDVFWRHDAVGLRS